MNRLYNIFLACCLVMATMVITSCEEIDFGVLGGNGGGNKSEQNANVVLHFSPFTQEGFTRGEGGIEQCASRLSVVVFKTDGTKVKTVTQRVEDDSFGTVGVALTEGSYRIVAIAHSCQGNATVTSVEKVTFPSNKVTDTFAYCGTIDVTDGERIEETLQMTRRVAMVRLTLAEPLAENIASLKFYYTGGSSTYSPATGYGCVQSKQTETRSTVAEDGSAVTTYEIYTMPHTEDDVLKITVTALGQDGSEVSEVVMQDVPVTRNKITTWSGQLFGTGGGAVSDGGITVTLDAEWSGTLKYNW